MFPGSTLDQIEALYRQRYGAFVRVARAITGDGELATEAVQEGFAGVLRSHRTFRGEGSLEGWVWKAVVNAARKAREPALLELGDWHGIEVPPALPELAPLISALPERQRITLFLRYYVDLDYRAIATALSIEIGTVSATLASAHRAIRQALQEVNAQ